MSLDEFQSGICSDLQSYQNMHSTHASNVWQGTKSGHEKTQRKKKKTNGGETTVTKTTAATREFRGLVQSYGVCNSRLGNQTGVTINLTTSLQPFSPS